MFGLLGEMFGSLRKKTFNLQAFIDQQKEKGALVPALQSSAKSNNVHAAWRQKVCKQEVPLTDTVVVKNSFNTH